ncbi:MAG: molybdenum cofactor guanylyltransferase [Candidatus Helarchaeota archaeon]
MLNDNISLIVLAGGQARRFQRSDNEWIDKLMISNPKWDDLPIIVYQIKKLKQLFSEILLVTSDEKRKIRYETVLKNHGISDIQTCMDKRTSCIGPLRGLHSGLNLVSSSNVLILPGDVPFIKLHVLKYLLDSSNKHDLGFYFHSNGRLESLVISMHLNPARSVINCLCHLHKRRVTDLIRGTNRSLFIHYTKKFQGMDGWERSFVNINTPEDIIQPELIKIASNSTPEAITLQCNHLSLNDFQKIQHTCLDSITEHPKYVQFLEEKEAFFWLGSLFEQKARSSSDGSSKRDAYNLAAGYYEKELKYFKRCPIKILKQHVLSDVKWCSDHAK